MSKYNTIIYILRMSTAVEQVVACVLVTQRVPSPVGTGFLGKVSFSGFSSPVRQMSGNFRPQGPRISFDRRNHHSIFAFLGWLSVCLVCIVFHVCAVSEVAPALGWSFIRAVPPCPCVIKKVSMWSTVSFPPPTGRGSVRPGRRGSRKGTYCIRGRLNLDNEMRHLTDTQGQACLNLWSETTQDRAQIKDTHPVPG